MTQSSLLAVCVGLLAFSGATTAQSGKISGVTQPNGFPAGDVEDSLFSPDGRYVV